MCPNIRQYRASLEKNHHLHPHLHLHIYHRFISLWVAVSHILGFKGDTKQTLKEQNEVNSIENLLIITKEAADWQENGLSEVLYTWF